MTVNLFDSNKLLIIAGPCALESKEICETVADVLAQLQAQYKNNLTFIFKTSFDKANRTDAHSARGLGIEKSLDIFSYIRKQYHLPTITDIHLPQQAAIVADVCDAIQIPAFLCRQTDLLAAAAQTQRTVNVKKGQFLSPYEMQFVVEKLKHFGAKEIWQTDRGTMFGYGSLVVDMRSFSIMRKNGYPALYDVTHSLQTPNQGLRTTGGDRSFALPLAKAALAAGAQGLFIETHPNPTAALSDRSTQLPLQQLPEFLKQCLDIWEITRHQKPLL